MALSSADVAAMRWFDPIYDATQSMSYCGMLRMVEKLHATERVICRYLFTFKIKKKEFSSANRRSLDFHNYNNNVESESKPASSQLYSLL